MTSALKQRDNSDHKPEESNDLFVVHGSINGPLGNLETVDMDNGDYRPGFSGVDVLVTVPGP